MANAHLKKEVFSAGSVGTVKALKKYWNVPVSDITDNFVDPKYTMLQMSLILKKKKLVEYLIPQPDLNLNVTSTDGTTSLMTGLEHDVPRDWIVAMLLQGATAGINIKDNEGRTALDRCEKGSEMWNLLVANGAIPPPEPEVVEEIRDPEKKDVENPIPFDEGKLKPEVEEEKNPGLNEYPGFWGNLCGCGGRPCKQNEELKDARVVDAGSVEVEVVEAAGGMPVEAAG